MRITRMLLRSHDRGRQTKTQNKSADTFSSCVWTTLTQKCNFITHGRHVHDELHVACYLVLSKSLANINCVQQGGRGVEEIHSYCYLLRLKKISFCTMSRNLIASSRLTSQEEVSVTAQDLSQSPAQADAQQTGLRGVSQSFPVKRTYKIKNGT